jgi:hypothetical protein
LHGTVATKDLIRGESGESVSIQRHFGGFMMTGTENVWPKRWEGAERLIIVGVLVLQIGRGWVDGHTLSTRVLGSVGKAPSRWLASRTQNRGIRLLVFVASLFNTREDTSPGRHGKKA